MMLPLLLAASLSLTTAPVLDGNGWQLDSGITHLDRSGWNVEFYDTISRDKLRGKMLLTAAELEKHTGRDFVVTSTINRTSAACPPPTSSGRHRIVVRLDPNITRSYAYMCAAGTGAAYGSGVHFSKVNWDTRTRAGSHEAYRRNVSSHELGHSVGLGHPYPSYLTGTDPLMSGDHWGGYPAWYSAHKYTPYDVNGLKRLVLNRENM